MADFRFFAIEIFFIPPGFLPIMELSMATNLKSANADNGSKLENLIFIFNQDTFIQDFISDRCTSDE